jgi:hypothetical protein
VVVPKNFSASEVVPGNLSHEAIIGRVLQLCAAPPADVERELHLCQAFSAPGISNAGDPRESLLTRDCGELDFPDGRSWGATLFPNHREASDGSIMANPAGQSIDPCFSRCCPREKTGCIFRWLLGPAGVLFGFLALLSFMPASPACTNDAHGNETSRTLAYGTAIAGTMATVWHPAFRLGATAAATPINPVYR